MLVRAARHRTRRSSDAPMVLAALGGALLTLFVTFSPLGRFAYDNLSLHVALETGEGLIGGLLAYLALQRYRARGAIRDAALAWTFAVLAATNLLLSALPIVTIGSRPAGTATWAAAGLRLCGAAGLCAAAYVPATAAWSERDVRRRLLVVSALAVVSVAATALAAGAWLPDAVDPFLSPASSSRPRVVGQPVVLAIQALAMTLFAAASVGFGRGARGADELLRWLAAGAVLAAFARLNYLLFPSLYSNWVYTGDVLRLASYLCFLVGATREIDAYRQDQTRLAVVDERRRMARDLHDGLLQELSFIRSQTADTDGGMRPGMAVHVAAAAERALHEARRAVEALSAAGPATLEEALREAAEEVASRAGTVVEVDAQPVGDVAGAVRETLARVAREATANAVRHGQAATVTVRLHARGGTLVLAVADDGKGFDPDVVGGSGFGLRSMRERVEALGGTFGVRSQPGRGTEVAATVPSPGGRQG